MYWFQWMLLLPTERIFGRDPAGILPFQTNHEIPAKKPEGYNSLSLSLSLFFLLYPTDYFKGKKRRQTFFYFKVYFQMKHSNVILSDIIYNTHTYTLMKKTNTARLKCVHYTLSHPSVIIPA